ncbi:MAG: Flp1 family type IVb pilin [Lachnospiraceae bacterium]|nr:Flp1 family type IVb pilin [Lachnospiraceae bacterium]
MAEWKSKLGSWKNKCVSVLKEDSGMGVVEVILIIVVLIGLVIIFQTNIKTVVSSIFKTIQTNAGKIK